MSDLSEQLLIKTLDNLASAIHELRDTMSTQNERLIAVETYQSRQQSDFKRTLDIRTAILCTAIGSLITAVIGWLMGHFHLGH